MSFSLFIKENRYEPFKLIQQQDICPNTGAQSIFIGYMRDFREEHKVDKMTLEYYPKMTEYQIEKIAQQVIKKYNLLDLLIAHRVGDVTPTDPIVTIAATASHRANAIEACKETLEQLKHQAPFWKKEQFQGENSWVLSNTKNNIH